MPGRGFGRGRLSPSDEHATGRGRGRGRGADGWTSRADEALEQMLGGGVRDDDQVQSPTKVVNTVPKKTQTFKRFQVTRKKKSKFAEPLSVPRAREPMWWTKLPADLTDPVTLEPIRELSAPPFEMSANGVMHYFDALSLANYLVSSAAFMNPINRQPLDGKTCRALDEHLAKHGLSQLKVEQALRLSKMIKAKKGTSTRLRREATSILHSLMDFQSYEDTRGVSGDTAPRGVSPPSNTQSKDEDAGWQQRYKRRQRVLHSEGNLAVVDDDEWDSEVVQRHQPRHHAQFADILGADDYDSEFPSLPTAPAEPASPVEEFSPSPDTHPDTTQDEREEEEEEEEEESSPTEEKPTAARRDDTVWGKSENVQHKIAADYLKWQKTSVKAKSKRNHDAQARRQQRDRQQQQQQQAVRRAQALRKKRQLRMKSEREKMNKTKVHRPRKKSAVATTRTRAGPKLLRDTQWMSTPLWGTLGILLAIGVMTYFKINSILSR